MVEMVLVTGTCTLDKGEGLRLLGMVRTLDTIWAWGERRGAARETGQYVPAANAAFEQSRRAALERIDYLRSER